MIISNSWLRLCAAAAMVVAVAPIAAQNTMIYQRASSTQQQRLPASASRNSTTQIAPPAVAREITLREHPQFESPYLGEEDRIVANTAYGPVTARDLYLYLVLAERPVPANLLEQYDESKLPTEREEMAADLREEIQEYVFTNLALPRETPPPPCHEIGAWKEYLYGLPGYQLVYLDKVVRPCVQILPADRVKYLQEFKHAIAQPERWRVRYIFMASNPADSIEERDAVRDTLEGVRQRVADGEIKFADAARQHSQASSASNGGEIPPFGKSELFFRIEEEAATLEPGGVSEVFAGPGGYYMVQLLETIPAEEPSLDNPEHARRVDRGLAAQVLRGQFQFEFDKVLKKKVLVAYSNRWDERFDDDIIAEVGDFKMSKQQFQDFFPEIESDDLKRRDELIALPMRHILEREAMAQTVRECGFEGDPLLQRMKVMAANRARRICFVEQIYCNLSVDEAQIRRFWADNPSLFTPLPMKRVVRLTMRPVNIAPTPEQALEELEIVMAGMAGLDGTTRGGGEPAAVAAGGTAGPPTAPHEERVGMSSFTSSLEFPRQRPLVPPLPLGYFPKINPSVLRETVLGYKSTDFQLRYDDYGFRYLDDLADIPEDTREELAKLGAGSFAKPVIDGNNAVVYYVEDIRATAKPGFEEIRAQAYAVYRQAMAEKEFGRTWKSLVNRAAIKFTF